MLDYAIVTPARDEADRLAVLAEVVRAQTVRARRWILVDCGSRDATASITAALARDHEWIGCVSVAGPPRATRGGPVTEAFEAGIQALDALPNVIVKLDADIWLPADYFERLLCRFEDDAQLGIAAGTELEPEGAGWRVRHTTATMVPGQARAYRRECLEEVLPLERRVGWDHVDQLKARSRGWKSLEVPELRFRHCRPNGERDGARYWHIQGAATHYLGYRPSYLLIRSLHRATTDRNALRMIGGYLAASARRQPRCRDRAVVDAVRAQQRLSQIPRRIRELHPGRNAELRLRSQSAR